MASPPKPQANAPTQPINADIDGNRLRLLESGTERLDMLLEIIRGAQKSIRLLFYMFNSDRSGRIVRDALTEAAIRGVEVRLLLDGFGSADMEPEFFAPLMSEGGDFCLFHPRYGRRYLVRNHQKLVVADERVALIGGANIEDDYLHDEGLDHWRDLWLRVEGPVVPAAARYFDDVYRWTTNKGAKLRNLRKLVFRHSQSEGALQWKFTAPLSRRNPWPFGFGRDMSAAGRLDIIAAYFAPPRFVLRRIARIAARGKVRIITAAKSDNNATIGAARHTYSRLLRRRVELYEYQPAKLHTKLAIIDDAVHIGSANFDFRSAYINLEVMLRIEDSGFAETMRGYFDRELAESEQITPEVHRRRANLWRRMKWTFSHWLVTTMDYTVTRRLNFGPDR